MTIMEFIKKMSGDKPEFKARFKEAQDDRKIQNRLDEREKSSNERELERIMRDKREEHIKQTLNQVRKKENKDLWKSPHSILKQEKSILDDDRPILKEKNIFKGNKNMGYLKMGGMFFK